MLLPIIVVLVFIGLMSKRSGDIGTTGGGLLSIGKSRARVYIDKGKGAAELLIKETLTDTELAIILADDTLEVMINAPPPPQTVT